MQKHVQRKAWQWGGAESGVTKDIISKETPKRKMSEKEKKKEKNGNFSSTNPTNPFSPEE